MGYDASFYPSMNIEGWFHCHAVPLLMTSSLWKSFSWMIYTSSFYIWCQIEATLKIEKFSKLTKILSRQQIFVGSVTGSWVYHLDSHSTFLHFELLIDTIALKLTELWHFQNLTYFLTSWPRYLTFDLAKV